MQTEEKSSAFLTNFHSLVDIRNCSMKPCKNGGTCVDHANGRRCYCRLGFTGSDCETGSYLRYEITLENKTRPNFKLKSDLNCIL